MKTQPKLPDWASKEDILKHNIGEIEGAFWDAHAQTAMLRKAVENESDNAYDDIFRCLRVIQTAIQENTAALTEAVEDYLYKRNQEIEEQIKNEPPEWVQMVEAFAPGRLMVNYTLMALQGNRFDLDRPEEQYHDLVNEVYSEVLKLKAMNKEQLKKYRESQLVGGAA
ncbi:MAG: hypothetical protein OEZ68_21990 [Gammaproteobacteria bacterium]|nr:hypothetical protein [Gammaproteobacteria bacterium]MDH5803462.1 hypothetical protein [Gammaproteobacteria bacterium]